MISKSIKKSINYIAGYLSSIPAIKSGRYTLYANVPVESIILNDTGKPPVKNKDLLDKEFDDRARITLDIVLCHGEDILTCIMLDNINNAQNISDMMNNMLKGMSYISVGENEVLSRKINYVSSFVNSRLSILESNPKSVSLKYSLQKVSHLKAVCNDLNISNGEFLYSLLVENSENTLSGTQNTLLGDLCGVFYRYEVNPLIDSISSFPVITRQNQSDLKLDMYSEYVSCDGKMPLNRRIEFLNKGMPSSFEAAEYTAKSLQQLLDAPIEAIFCLQPEWLRNFEEDIEKIKMHSKNYALSSEQMKIETYKDVMDFLYRYYSESRKRIDCSNEEVIANCGDVFIDLIVGLRPPLHSKDENNECNHMPKIMSLKERIERINTYEKRDYTILYAPIGSYFYAASLLKGNCYPRLVYEKGLSKMLNNMNIGNSLLGIAERIGYNISKGDAYSKWFSILGKLFIEPVCNQSNNL